MNKILNRNLTTVDISYRHFNGSRYTTLQRQSLYNTHDYSPQIWHTISYAILSKSAHDITYDFHSKSC